MLKLIVQGSWPEENVRSVCARKSTLAVPEAVAKIVEETWNEKSSVPGIHLFDGPMCRFEWFEHTADALTLYLSETSYKHFLGTNMHHPELREQLGPEVMANPVGLSAAVISSDGYIMMGRRNPTVAYYPNRIHPFAGALEPRDESAASGIRRELLEELSLREEIRELCCIGIIEDRRLIQPEVVFEARIDATKDQIQKKMDPIEHREAIPTRLSEGDLATVLSQPQALTPVGIGTLLLTGGRHFGQAWLQKHGKPFFSTGN